MLPIYYFSDPQKPPESFLLLRITSTPPCLVLRVAFLGGTSGEIRYDTIKELRAKVETLKFSKRGSIKSNKVKISPSKGSEEVVVLERKSPLMREWSEISCCILLSKPIEHVLIGFVIIFHYC